MMRLKIKIVFQKILLLGIAAIFLSGCNLFDNKVQGQVGQSSVATDPKRPKLADRVGLAAFAPEYLFDEGTRQDIKVIFSKELKEAATISWQVEKGGDDFNLTTGTLNLEPGAASFEIPLIAMVDTLYEGGEVFNLVINIDEDYFAADLVIPLRISEKAGTPPQMSFSKAAESVTESKGQMTVAVNLSQATAQLVKAKLVTTGAAELNVDFAMTPPTDLVFNPGETSKLITIGIIDDEVLGESLEEVTISLDRIDAGTASIDNANKSFSVLIEDNDIAVSPISVVGVTGGADTSDNFYLTSGNHPKIKWTAPTLTTETGFDVTIYEPDAITIRCQTMTTGIDSTMADFSSCDLVEGGTYKISVVANIAGGGALAAQNNMVPFVVDTTPPEAFVAMGVMGGNDIVPDGYLAGALTPTAVWQDAQGEGYYTVKILNSAGNSFNPANCEVANVPANTTSYSFENCTLAISTNYKIRVLAHDNSGTSTQAPDLGFYVTNNQSGYLVLGVLGGTGDATPDENMDDGSTPRVQWQKALNADKYEVKIRNLANTADVCTLPGDGLVGGSISDITFTTCNLSLHDQYNLVVKVRTFSGSWVEAANSPYVFRHRVGLYIDGTGGSYINGQSIISCGGAGGGLCDASTPYVATDLVQYDKIRISNNGVLAGGAWTGNTPTSGNGILDILVNYLTLDTGGKISMTGRGYTAGQGPGAGSGSGNLGIGGSHGGQAGLASSFTQGPTYGDVLNPSTMGSAGSNGGAGTLGGAGGGIINVTVNNLLNMNGSTVAIESNGASGTVASCGVTGGSYCAYGGGGGAGGSISVFAEEIRGTVGSKIRANGGGTDALSMTPTNRVSMASAGGGGRVAFRYQTSVFPDLTTLVEATGMKTENYSRASSYSAAGTAFFKGPADPAGHLLVVQSDDNLPHVQGVETPIPIGVTFDSIRTINKGTLIIPSTDIYTHFSNIIDFRLVVAGDLQIPSTGSPLIRHLKIGKDAGNPGMVEWRRLASLAYDKLTIVKDSELTHSKNSSVASYRLVIDTPEIEVFGRIDASGRGFGMGYGPGRPTGTYGASYGGLGGISSSGTRSGVYGNLMDPRELGSGGSSNSAGYDLLGEGGGSVEIIADTLSVIGEYNVTSKVSGTGSIRVDGRTGDKSGGSGGSLKITTKQFFGKYGTISAIGGDSSAPWAFGGGGAGGGGGRIAIFYEHDNDPDFPVGATYLWSPLSTFPYVELATRGGSGITPGASGTTFLKKTSNDGGNSADEPADPNGHLWVFNLPNTYNDLVTTTLNDSLPLDSIVTDSSGTVHIPAALNILLPTNSIGYRIVIEGEYTNPNPPDLSIANGGYLEWRKASPLFVSGGASATFTVDTGGVFTHTRNGTTRQYLIHVIADNMVVKGTIDANGKGYAPNSGPGAPGSRYWGAAHAGNGSDSESPRVGAGTPYGIEDTKNPIELGSASHCSNGGGAIRLQITNKLEFVGASALIDASAPNAASGCPSWDSAGGASSGGSISISASEILGTKVAGVSPLIKADGGAGNRWWQSTSFVDGFSGSGGRIAIVTNKDAITGLGLIQAIKDKNITAIGGRNKPEYAAAAGTIYIKRSVDASNNAYALDESLYLHNDGLTYYDRIETPIPDTLTFDEMVTLGNATLIVTSGQIYHLASGALSSRLVVGGLFTSQNNDLTIKDGGYLQWRRSTPLILNNLLLETGGTLTHTSNFSDSQFRMELQLQNLTLQQGSSIDLTGKGFQYESGPGAGASGDGTNTGGAYGGNSRSNLSYGSVTYPVDLGSGGGNKTGSGATVGGSGGGNLQIKVSGLADINGSLISNGADSSAAGSGGTILLDVNQLSFSNNYSLQARGGTGTLDSGSGGRIALRYNSYVQGSGGPVDIPSAAQSSSISARGGTGGTEVYGAAGTIYYIDKNDPTFTKGYLVLKNAPNPYSEAAVTPLPDQADFNGIFVDSDAAVEVRLGESVILPSSTLTYRLIMGGNVQTPDDNLTIASGGTLEVRRGALLNDFTNLTIQNGGVMTHTSNADLRRYWIDLVVQNLTLDSGGKITADGKGYGAGYGPSPGCNGNVYSIFGGGSHAGFGSSGGYTCARQSYGSIKNPLELGSGGGHNRSNSNLLVYQPGASGGGFIKLTVSNIFTLNGTLSANGNEGTCWNASSCGGSGAGGSVSFNVHTLVGTTSALVRTNGGVKSLSAHEQAAGGGGRVALQVTNSDSGFNTGNNGLMDLSVQARGGNSNSTYPGAAGTIWRKGPAATNGHLLISNIDTPFVPGTYTELFNYELFDSVQIGANGVEAAITGIGVRKATSFDFKTSDLNFPLAAAGNTYFTGAAGHLGNLNVKGGGIFEVFGDQPFVFNNIIIESGGKITHGQNSTSLANLLKLTAASLHVQSGGSIDVSGRGYQSGNGPGAGKAYSVLAGGGASFGGSGGAASDSTSGAAGATYGTPSLGIFTMGSGGGHGGGGTCLGGAGGGGILLTVGTLQLDLGASIKANGANGKNMNGNMPCYSGGGGSGGSIKISVTDFNTNDANTAASRLQVRGGGIDTETASDGAGDGGGGGGGRIAITYTNGGLVNDTVLNNWSLRDGGGSESGDRNGSSGTLEVNGSPY